MDRRVCVCVCVMCVRVCVRVRVCVCVCVRARARAGLAVSPCPPPYRPMPVILAAAGSIRAANSISLAPGFCTGFLIGPFSFSSSFLVFPSSSNVALYPQRP